MLSKYHVGRERSICAGKPRSTTENTMKMPAHTLAGALNRDPHGVTRIAALCVTIVWCFGSACIDIEGGAAEVSWSLRSFEGVAVETCGETRIEDIRLCWALAEEEGATADPTCDRGHRDFPCGESSGVTGFQLEPGTTAFWIEPLCVGGEPAVAGTYQVPPPIVRNVEQGEIVSLNSLLLVVSPDEEECPPVGCTCMQP